MNEIDHQKKMGFFRQFKNSVTDFNSYNIYIIYSLRRAFLYLFLLTLIFGTITGVKVLYDFNTGLNEIIQGVQTEIPNFKLQNGELFVDANMPLLLDKSQDSIFIIDTSEQTNQNILKDYPRGILITKNEVIQKKNEIETSLYSFKDLGDLVVTKSDFEKYLPYLKILNVFIVVFGFIGFFIGKLFSVLILSLVGLLISKIQKYDSGFGNLFKVSIYVLTLPLMIKTVLVLFDVTIPYFSLLYYGIAIFYLWHIIKILNRPKDGTVII